MLPGLGPYLCSLASESAIGLMAENFALNDLAEDAPEAEGLSPSPSPSSSSSGDGVAVRARVLDWEQPLPDWVSLEADQSIWPDLIMWVPPFHTASLPPQPYHDGSR
jgi:hypothetical protein